jgi:hypothetical protein
VAWKEETAMSNKKLFIKIATEENGNFSTLCRRFNISRECGYKWLKRYKEFGPKGLEEQSRKPFLSPPLIGFYIGIARSAKKNRINIRHFSDLNMLCQISYGKWISRDFLKSMANGVIL